MTSQTDPVREFVASQDLPVGTIKKTQSSHTGYTARLWKIVTVDGVEESRKVYNNSTYKASNEIYSVGLANASPEAAAAINNAIATQNEAYGSARRSASGQTGARRPDHAAGGLRLRRRRDTSADSRNRLRERIRAEDRRDTGISVPMRCLGKKI